MRQRGTKALSAPAQTPSIAQPNTLELARKLVALKELVDAEIKRRKLAWKPFPDKPDGTPHPQRLALESKADILLYGGAAGGGKSDLLLGAAGRNHYRSVIFRRVFPSLRAIIDRSRQIFNPEGTSANDDSYNEGLYRWRFKTGPNAGAQLRFGSLQYEKDVNDWQGQPHDYYGFDELTEFTEYQFRFVTGWNRPAGGDPNQRCRVIATCNPPTTKEGEWIIRYFAPWLDPNHPNPAKEGELRWFTTVGGKDFEMAGPDDKSVIDEITGEPIIPKSRTFISAKVQDNPILVKSGYIATLQAMPEPLRSKLLYGDFKSGMEEDPWQVIPTTWVLAAQKRWREHPLTSAFKFERDKVVIDEGYIQAMSALPMSQMGVDVSRGGNDNTVLTPRHQYYVPRQVLHPGPTMKDGQAVLTAIINARVEPDTLVAVDVVGVGSSPYDFAKAAFKAVPLDGSHTSEAVSKQGKLGFFNQRSEWYWNMREMLDPASGYDICLPDDRELLVDLCAFKWKHGPRGIQVQSKDEVKPLIGRSPDKGDSCIYAFAKPHIAGAGIMEFMKQQAEEIKAARGKGKPGMPDRPSAAAAKPAQAYAKPHGPGAPPMPGRR